MNGRRTPKKKRKKDSQKGRQAVQIAPGDMVSTRRKSVSFSADSRGETRRRNESADAREDPIEEQPPAKKPATERTAQPAPAAKAKKKVEADGRFKFKRAKKMEAPPLQPVVQQEVAPAADLPRPVPQTDAKEHDRAPAATADNHAVSSTARSHARGGGGGSGSHDSSSLAPVAPNLDGLPLTVLRAFLEECNERAKQQPRHDGPPSKMELAMSACVTELTRQGVTEAPRPTNESLELRMRESVLEQRLAELTAAKSNWEAAASDGVSTSRWVQRACRVSGANSTKGFISRLSPSPAVPAGR